MNADFLLKHFERIAEAPDAIPRLRRFILDLAVRGRLVPQDPNDEPAAKLLKRKSEKTIEDAPFPIPDTWAWVRVDEIAESRLGKMLDKAKNKGELRRYLRNVNVRWFDFDFSNILEMRFEDSELEEFSLRRGDVLICEGGEPGRAAVWDERETNIYFQKAIHRLRFPKGANSHYFVNVLREAADSRRLVAYFTGVGIKHLTGKGLSSFLFPLPPLAEQHRIVAKVDELMILCDQLETAKNKREAKRDQLITASLHRIGVAQTAITSATIRFHLDQLPRLTTHLEHIKQLRQTILNLAVRGRLVPQDPNDEPAEELLEFFKGGLCEIPSNWIVAKVGKLLDFQYGKGLPASDRLDKGRVYVFGSNGVVGYCTESLTEESAIIIGRKGSAGALNLCIGPSWTTDVAYFVKPPPFFDIRFLFITLQTLDLGNLGKGVKPGLSRSDAYELEIVVPPLAEQHRIVAKVDELMILCDQLEAQLIAIQANRRRLLEAVLHKALDE